MEMEKCKTIEAKIDFLKTLLEKLTLMLLALGGGFGTLLVKFQAFTPLKILNFFLLVIVLFLWLLTLRGWWILTYKLDECEEEKE